MAKSKKNNSIWRRIRGSTPNQALSTITQAENGQSKKGGKAKHKNVSRETYCEEKNKD